MSLVVPNQQGLAWAIVEVYGHQRYAGEVSEVTLYGAPACRVYVPSWSRLFVEQEWGVVDDEEVLLERDVIERHEAFEVDLGGGAIFRRHLVTEATARAAVPGSTRHHEGHSREEGAWRPGPRAVPPRRIRQTESLVLPSEPDAERPPPHLAVVPDAEVPW